jgi:uncharacterized protein (DUF2225 family)
MTLITCPECKKRISDQAEACPHCGFPLFRKECEFIEVYFNGSWISGEKQLKNLIKEGWQIVDTQEFIDDDGVDVTRHKLEKRVLNQTK